MDNTAHRAVAIVGVGAILPDAPNAAAFWNNVKTGRYSISEVTPERWDAAAYYDADPAAPDKTYSKIGGWVREYDWEPMKWHLPIPPKVANAMDPAQHWGIACTRAALEDYGYPRRPLELNRTAVILGNAMAGERHYLTSMRVFFPEYARELAETASFAALPATVRKEITEQLHHRMGDLLPEITEDSMPGELANCIAGRIANLYNFHGPNYTCDAACASAMAAITSAVEGLVENVFDVAVTGGIDRNMGAPTFVKFCKIGALSATGTRPFAQGADGFVMGEGAAIFLMKRLADAERDQDKIYAVLRGIAGASDGKGKGITAPNPIGQKLCVERAWQNAGVAPGIGTLIEGHGTSTRVGDVVEASSMVEVLSSANLPVHSVALGSVKSNIGHLKGAAGAAGVLKATLALHDKVLPPSLHCEHPSPDIDFAHSPLYVNTELRSWEVPNDGVRRAGVSAFGFGGTNFHVVLEEHIPGRLNGNGKKSVKVPVDLPTAEIPVVMQATVSAPVAAMPLTVASVTTAAAPSTEEIQPIVSKSRDASSPKDQAARKVPLRGALVLGATTPAELLERVKTVLKSAQAGQAPAFAAPADADLAATERVAIDYADAADLASKCGIALKALQANQPAFWKAVRAQGIFRGHGPAPKVAFLYTGQGSQYANMLRGLRERERIIAETFKQADRVMTPLLGKPLTAIMYVDPADQKKVAEADEALRQTEITQPAVITINMATTRLLAAYGIRPDMTMGHSVGEYGALVAAGAWPFEDALEAVSARGRGMTQVAMADNGKMAAVFAPLAEVERLLKTVDGYVVIANVNSNSQSVIGGATDAINQAVQIFTQAGYDVRELPVSHAFHTSIVAPASTPLKQMLTRLRLQTPQIPIVANVNGEFYPTGVSKETMTDMLGQQVAAPVQFVKGLRTLYDAGARVFVEVGPKKALQGFAEDVLGGDPDVFSLFTNHPKLEDATAFNQALCGMYAAGLGRESAAVAKEVRAQVTEGETRDAVTVISSVTPPNGRTATQLQVSSATSEKLFHVEQLPGRSSSSSPVGGSVNDRNAKLGELFAEVLDRGWEIYKGERPAPNEPVVITGASVGLPGTERVFDDANIARLLNGDQFIGPIPDRFRRAMLDKNITRLVKSANGDAVFDAIHDVGEVIKLAGRGRTFDLQSEFGVPADHIAAFDRVTQLAIAAGLDALRDAGIPLIMRYKTTTKGTQLPERWGLPDELRDETGVIMGSAFPGYDSYAEIMGGYYADRARREELARLEKWSAGTANGHSAMGQEVARRIDELRALLEKEPYVFDRRFLLRVLSMGHSQFAELIGARGPNTQINAACATTAQAVSLAEDWIRAGRCRRVIVISADDVTSDNMIEWFGAGFLASGAAATDEAVEEAAIPFDRRRHGLIMGMGAAALVVESAGAARERGIQPICEVLSAVTANSAFHGTRLDVEHIGQVMEDLIAQAESRGIQRQLVAPQMVFVSHETYTPARGGSASAEVNALRRVFGERADQIVVANTKGLTGHAMATGIEDVLAVKTLETGLVPPVANFKEVDPELGPLNLSKGGDYPVEYALHLGAGFGSQISMILLHRIQTKDGGRPRPDALGYAYRVADPAVWNQWLARIAGYPKAELEVVKRTLRVHDQGPQPRATAPLHDSHPATTPKPVTTTSAKPATAAVATATAVTEATPAPAAIQAAARATATATAPVKEEAKPAVATVAVPPATTASTTAAEDVKQRILALVVEKTGYPEEMLDLDLDMEADLGVDTVKQAEIFAAIRESYNIPRDENRKLRDYPTLSHVIRFVLENRPDLSEQTTSATLPVVPPRAPSEPAPGAETTPTVKSVAASVAPSTTATTEAVKQSVLALVVTKTGYPEEMLDLDLDMEADLGVDTVKQAEIFAAIRETYNIPRDENRKLRDYPTLGHVIRFVFDMRPDLAGGSVPAPVPANPAETAVTKPVETTPALAPQTSVVNAANAATIPDTTSPPAGTLSLQSIQQKVMDIVAEKTGYPKEMLDLDLDLEADLGIDTVKQAEMFASVRAAYGIPRDENMKLRDFPTLAHVIKFAQDRAGTVKVQATTAPSTQTPATTSAPAAPTTDSTPAPATTIASTTATAALSLESIQQKVMDIVAEKTGYPKEMLDLDLDLEADLGIDTVKQAEMFASVRAAYGIPRDENMKLRDFPTMAHVIKFAQDRAGTVTQASAGATTAQTPATPIEPEPTPVRTPAATVSPAPATTMAASTTPTVAVAAPSLESIQQKVMDIVAEKTGYPKEMLDLDLDLEADLGIDTVKQAEMFASVRAAYGIQRDENMKLRDFPTMAHVIKFAQDRAGVAKTEAATEVQSAAAVVTTPPPELLSFDAANKIPRRVPIPVLRPPLAMCKATGVTLGAGSRVIVMADKGGVAESLLEELKGRGAETLCLVPGTDNDTLLSTIESWLKAGPVQGIFWLPALDVEPAIAEMDIAAWRENLRIRVKSLYAIMRRLYEQIAGANTFLITATRLGGQHGYNEEGAASPMGGAVVGFTKAYKRERPETLVKAVDFGDRKSWEITTLLIDEALRDAGAVEIGYKDGLRWTVGLEEQPAIDGIAGLALNKHTVFVITGAAGSIVSAITQDLAAASGGTFYLLDLVPEPDADNPDLTRFVTDKDGLKRELFARIQARGERATPALVEKELAALERANAALSAIRAVESAGGTAHYFSVNLADADAVAKVIAEVRKNSGHIDVLLHAAGLERSHFLPDKDTHEFDLVFDVKTDGWFNLLHAIGDMPLGATVAFSSVAGRFGNGGQTDYSSANDLLCKYTSSFRTTRPTTRGIVIDWSAWGGIGMATRGSIPKMMELAGIDMIPPEAGIPIIRRELTSGGFRGEIVVAGRLGIMLQEWDPTGGLDVTALSAASEALSRQGPMVGRITGVGIYSGLTMETTLDPSVQPFLYDHRIDGTPVLPGVMGIEAFAEVALCLHPGWHIDAVEEVNFFAPFKFYKNDARILILQSIIHPVAGELIADCRLTGRRTLPNSPEPQETLHFTARVRLSKQAPEAATGLAPRLSSEGIVNAAQIYRIYFHGPAYQVVERAWSDGERIVGEMSSHLPQNHHPSERPTLIRPRMIELCFQTAGLWQMAAQGRMGLPWKVHQVTALTAPKLNGEKIYAVVTPHPDEGTFDAEVMDANGTRYLRLGGYRTVELPDNVDAEPLKELQNLLSPHELAAS